MFSVAFLIFAEHMNKRTACSMQHCSECDHVWLDTRLQTVCRGRGKAVITGHLCLCIPDWAGALLIRTGYSPH